MNRVKQAVHAENVYKYGLSGKNVTVAIMDTGVAMHRDFDNRILAFHDFCNGYQAPYDDNGHGTHVTGIIAGSGRMSARENGVPVYGGMAPQAGIVMLKVLDKKGNGKTGQVLEAIRWLREHRAAYNIRLLNISVGMLPNAGISEQQALLRAVDGLWDAGIMVVAAAGNNGPRENTVTIPGISRKIVTVGSSDDGGSTGSLAKGYSGMGPTECCIVKPEILAPGTNIMSCAKDGTGYVKKSGTSMAVPVVTGALALALEKYPNLTPAELKLRLYERAYPRGEHIGKKCWGVLHLDYLLRGNHL